MMGRWIYHIVFGNRRNEGKVKLAILLSLTAVVLFLIATMDVHRTMAEDCDCGACHYIHEDCAPCHSFPPVSGSHTRHVKGTSSGYDGGFVRYSCSACHSGAGVGSPLHNDGNIDVILDSAYGGSYSGTPTPGDSYGSCSNVSCHSNVQPDGGTGDPTAYGNPAWGVATRCAGCHRTTTDLHAGIAAGDSSRIRINSGSHTAHLNYRFNVYNGSDIRKCVICHKMNPSAPYPDVSGCNIHCHDAPKAHGNDIVDINIDPYIGGSYVGGSTPPGDGYSNCSNTYCHSNGTSVSTDIIPYNTSSNWGSGPLFCNSCHGNPPGYANGNPKANSHLVSGHSRYSCDNCHYSTTIDGTSISSKTSHVNKSYNVTPGTGISFSYSFATTGGTCSNVSCHTDGATMTWGR